ncbi:hypothetical protein C3B59_05690 [Cryobacterium zongtaii]|uniref:Uncharacterized protein n=1 Tax=Cryobacterium zongtaii TaxID=1259217 RepID=A0A2S3ZLH9_9MICO|nr:hypothetical protein [Cryobacterium zongtaii]POH69381.1 hypothetical protein C3B59_05690 [Cryobacterium zongtaii]
MSRVSIVLDLAAHEYRALAAIAGSRGVQSHVLIEQLVRHALNTSRPAPVPAPKSEAQSQPKPKYVPRPMPKRSKAMIRTDRDEQFVAVSKLHGQGLSDGQIAAQLGINAAMARQRRLQLKLPAQGKPGRRPRTTNAAPAAEKS